MSLEKPMNLFDYLVLILSSVMAGDLFYSLMICSNRRRRLTDAFHLLKHRAKKLSLADNVYTAHSMHVLIQKCPYNVTYKSLCAFRAN
ncbi:mCG147819 [Mus musculus]|jgi:hypothetical protein|nr:mCG147819 [Mus musculus]